MEVEQVVGAVPADWNYLTLGEACTLGGGQVQTGPFGSQLHASDYVIDGVPSIMPQNIGDNRIIQDGIARIALFDAERLARYRVQTGDIVYSRRGDVEKRALIHPKENGWLCGTGCLRVRFGDGPVDPAYASYYLGDSRVREWVVRHAHGATMPNLNTEILSALPFVLPPLDEQRAIAHILGTLDDKIKLNRQMNETLEAIARALFKSWFVDFDPVRAKSEGRDASLPPHLADLFPDSFEDSELGEIPAGWRTAPLAEFVEITKGCSYKTEDLVESDTALVTLKSFARGGGYRRDGLKSFSGKYRPDQVVEQGEIVIACTDVTQAAEVIGRTAVVPGSERFRTLVASQDTLIVRPRHSGMTRASLYFLGRADAFVVHTRAYSTGTTVLHLAREAVPSFRFAIPPRLLVDAFDGIASLALTRMQAAEDQSDSLVTLRDSLLPRLMSGELRVPEAERFAARVGS